MHELPAVARPLLLPVASSLPAGSLGPFAGPTVPFPAELLDRAMPRLSDTEWRLVCVVVRQTLGWYDKETWGRKERDWLTQSQLVARTGRTAKPVAEAVAALTAKRLIRVVSDRGEELLTPEQRRRCPGRHWFQLHPQWRNAWLAGAGGGEAADAPPGLRRGENTYGGSTQGAGEEEGMLHPEPGLSGEGEAPDANLRWGPSQNPAQARGASTPRHGVSSPRPDLWAEACGVFTVEKVHTTKETDYKKSGEGMKNGREFLHSDLRERQQGRSLPERAGESAHVMPRDGGKGGRRERQAVTIYGPSSFQARDTWEQEAAGHRWIWRKDLAKWTSREPDTESREAAESGNGIVTGSKK